MILRSRARESSALPAFFLGRERPQQEGLSRFFLGGESDESDESDVSFYRTNRTDHLLLQGWVFQQEFCDALMPGFAPVLVIAKIALFACGDFFLQ